MPTLVGLALFPRLDLKSRYWQVEMGHADRNGTTAGYSFSFGLCNALAMFERLTERALSWKTCLVYAADLIVMGTFEEYKESISKTSSV